MVHDPNEASAIPVGEAKLPPAVSQIFGGKKPTAAMEYNLKYFGDIQHWFMSTMLVMIQHAIPELTTQEAVEYAVSMADQLRMPGTRHKWSIARYYIERRGLPEVARRVASEILLTAQKPSGR